MEYGSIEREIHIDASPDVVFDVISSPEHIREWWGGVEADVEPTAGATGELVWGDRATGEAMVVPITVVDAVASPALLVPLGPSQRARSRTPTNSLLVTFELVPSGAGTVLRLTETGFREMGWEVAVLEEAVPGARRRLGHLRSAHRRVRHPAGVHAMTVAVDDDLWSAIGDPTRRRMLDLLLADGGGTATTLSDRLPVTRQAVAKHLGVLDRVGLVHVTPAGREMRYRVDDAQLARAVRSSQTSGRPGTPGYGASSGSPRPSSAAKNSESRTASRTREKGINNGGHPAQNRGQVVPGRRLRGTDHDRGSRPAGGRPTRKATATSAECSSSASVPAGST